MNKTLGGQRLGAGGRQTVQMKDYGRSTHDMGAIFRTTMAPGTLVPFYSKLCTPGDVVDIDLNVALNTYPTVGPLFGSYKLQMDVFVAPFRLYQGL